MTSVQPIPNNAKSTVLNYRPAVSAGIALCAILALAPGSFAQNSMAHGTGGATVPLSTYSITATKDTSKKPRTGALVGTSPFATALSGSTIKAVVIPIIFNIGGVFLDSTAPNSCYAEGGLSAASRFMASPLVVPVNNLTFDGVDVGNVQYVDGFMRAEFWNTTKGNPAYANPISYTQAAPITIVTGSTTGITDGTGCDQIGIVSEAYFQTQLASQMQTLTTKGVISPSQFVLFLAHNIILATNNTPAPWFAGCCNSGYHSWSGSSSAPQFFAWANYNTAVFGTYLAKNTTVAAHEIAEFMNDPYGSNQTPAWGGVGDVPSGSCQANLEVGDPLVGTQIAIAQGGYTYSLVELAFFSWFFDSPTTASLGAGGKFSSNGTFGGPSMACPPGGTYN